MSKTLYLITVFFLLHLCCTAQDTLVSKPKFYTHKLIGKVTDVDTVLLVSEDYRKDSQMPLNNFRAIRVKLKVCAKMEGVFNQKKIIIMLDLNGNEHNCHYNFEKGKIYQTYIFASRYKADEILIKYRKKIFRLDCYNPPVSIER